MTVPLVPPPDAPRRRLHAVGRASTMTALGCAVLLALATGGGDMLGQGQDPRPGQADGGKRSVVPPRQGAPSAGPAPRPGQEAAVQAAPRRAPAGRAAAPDRSPPGTTTSPAPAPASEPMTREGPVLIVAPRTSCTVGDRTLCTGVDVRPAGRAFTVSAHVCSHGPAPIVLRFVDDLEVDLVVGPYWRWSDTQLIDPTPHELHLQQGQCWRWTTTYDGLDAEGRRLPAGNHRMTAEFLAADLGNARQSSSDFPVRD